MKELIAQGASFYVASRVESRKVGLFWSIAAGTLCSIGFIFLSVATFFYFAQNQLLAASAIYTATLIFVLAFGCYIYMRIKQSQIKKEAEREKQAILGMASIALDTYERELEEPVKEHPALSLLLSGLTGFAVAKRYL